MELKPVKGDVVVAFQDECFQAVRQRHLAAMPLVNDANKGLAATVGAVKMLIVRHAIALRD